MKTLLYVMMVYPMTTMVQSNDSFKMVLSSDIIKAEAVQYEPKAKAEIVQFEPKAKAKVEPKVKARKFNPKSIQLGIKVNE